MEVKKEVVGQIAVLGEEDMVTVEGCGLRWRL